MEAVDLAFDVFKSEDGNSETCPIILTHGLFWNKFMFKGLGSQISKTLKRTVYSLDLRNHGESPAPKGLTIELMAEDVIKFMKDKSIKKADFVCHSISSTVPYLMALAEPDIVQKIVMVDCPPLFDDYDHIYTKELVDPQVSSQQRMLRTLDPDMSLAQAKSKFNVLALKGDKVQELFFKKAAYDIVKVNGKFQWRVDLDYLLQRYKENVLYPERKDPFNHDLLVVRCINSRRVTDEAFEKVLKLNQRSKLVTFENATHLLMLERPYEFTKLLEEYFRVPHEEFEDKRVI